LFEKSEEDKIHQARAETQESKTQVDRPVRAVVKESVQTPPVRDAKANSDPFGYMNELNKF
jgi:hypothetical protein